MAVVTMRKPVSRVGGLRIGRMLRRISPIYILLIPLIAFTSLPLIFVFSTAFKPLDELFLFPPEFFVRRPVMDNFEQLLIATAATTVPFTRYLFNSVFITGVSVLLTILIASMAAYPLAKMPVPGKNFIFAMVVSALMFAPQVTSIPRYLVVNQLGLIDSYWAIILPHLATPFNVFLMKQFMEQVPFELIEAGRIDGAGEFRIFWQLVMPLVRPAWATLTIFAFLGTWNDVFSVLIFTRSDAMRTLPLAIFSLGGGAQTVARQGAIAAANLLLLLPVLILFLIMQKRVMQTMAHSGIKS